MTPLANGTFEVAASLTAVDGFTPVYSSEGCPGYTAPFDGAAAGDQVWLFTAPTAGEWRITLASDTDAQLSVYLTSACDSCIGHADAESLFGDEKLNLTVTEAGQAFYLVVDGVEGDVGNYALSARSCPPFCEDIP